MKTGSSKTKKLIVILFVLIQGIVLGNNRVVINTYEEDDKTGIKISGGRQVGSWDPHGDPDGYDARTLVTKAPANSPEKRTRPTIMQSATVLLTCPGWEHARWGTAVSALSGSIW